METWDDLRYFLALAHGGTLPEAAARLSVSHTTVFRRVRRLEKRLSTRLFDTTPSGWVLTPAGRRLRVRAEEVADQVSVIWSSFDGLDARVSGPVSIAVDLAVATGPLPSIIDDLQRSHPGLELTISVSTDAVDFGRREADIAVRFTESPPPHLIGWQVGQCHLVPMAAPSRVASHGLRLADHAAEGRFLLVRGQRPPWWDGLSLDADPARVLHVDDMAAASAMCRAGLGVLMLPSLLADDTLVPLIGPSVGPISAWVLMHPDLRGMPRYSGVAQVLVDRLRRGFAMEPS